MYIVYDHGEVMHMMFYWGVVSYSGVIALLCLNFNDFSVLNNN